MKLENNPPFEDYTAYKVWHKKEGRYMVNLVSETKRTTISYAKYLLSIHKKRWLNKEEEVDHINGDKSDDRIENLQILTKKENNLKRLKELGITRKMVEFKCGTCEEVFVREYNQTHLVKKANKSTYCSRKCSSRHIRESEILKIFRKQ